MPNDNIEQNIKDILESGATPDEKISALNDLIAGLSFVHQVAEARRVAEAGALIAAKAGKTEMAAQFCFMRAKAEIAEAGKFIGEMKNITMAINWFEFGLEAEKKRFKELDAKLQTNWGITQKVMNMGYDFINKKPYIGAGAYCQRTAGQIYGTYYLQLKLHYFTTGRPWRARFGNYALSRWLGIDDLFILSKRSRAHLRSVKRDCIKSLHQAKRLFKRIRAYDYLVETYFDLALEHHSFNDSLRSKFYLWWGWLLMKWHRLQEPRLAESFASLRELPLIGSNRDGRPMDELQPQL
ncbi:MAG: hypothetical protein KGH79_01825 [Patescibacteria group bacterium]|nr:hypothetical protein [Patescibacteria group bacterium]